MGGGVIRGNVRQPSYADVLRDHRKRISILEAVTPTSGLIVTDGGGTTVDPTTQLDIGAGLVLTDLGSGEAEIQLSDYQVWTPTLSAMSGSGTDPTVGSGATLFGRYFQANEFVHYYGSVLFGSGLSSGTGLWQVDLPLDVAFNPFGEALGFANMTCFSCALNVGKQMQMEAQQTAVGGFAPNASHIGFYYLDAYPFGNLAAFDHTSPYAVANGDLLSWNILYQMSGGL